MLNYFEDMLLCILFFMPFHHTDISVYDYPNASEVTLKDMD